jgi:hypothetical protein
MSDDNENRAEIARETLLPKRRADFARAHDAAYEVRVELEVRPLDQDCDGLRPAVHLQFRFLAPDAEQVRKGVEAKVETFDAALCDLEGDEAKRALDFISDTERARQMLNIASSGDEDEGGVDQAL